MTILDEIIAMKRLDLKKSALTDRQRDDYLEKPLLKQMFKRQQLNVIAEIKRASPSKGVINSNIDPVLQAKRYEASGASCISVLTEQHYFKGSFADLRAVSKAVAIPVLCKDFIIDRSQIDAAKYNGASVILLIVAALTEQQLIDLYSYACEQKLEVLVEVHTTKELKIAFEMGAMYIGINNRDLKTFHVSLEHFKNIMASVQDLDGEHYFISESGIHDENDAAFVFNYGAHAILVGETFMKSEDVAETMQKLSVKGVQ